MSLFGGKVDAFLPHSTTTSKGHSKSSPTDDIPESDLAALLQFTHGDDHANNKPQHKPNPLNDSSKSKIDDASQTCPTLPITPSDSDNQTSCDSRSASPPSLIGNTKQNPPVNIPGPKSRQHNLRSRRLQSIYDEEKKRKDNKRDFQDDGVMKYELRPRANPIDFGVTWIDHDQSGDYDPQVADTHLKTLPKRKRTVEDNGNEHRQANSDTKEKRARLRSWAFGRRNGAEFEVVLKLRTENSKKLLKELYEKHGDNWPDDDDIDDDEEGPNGLENMEKDNNLYRLRKRFSTQGNNFDDEEDREVNELIGKPEGRGCRACWNAGLQCSMVDLPQYWPCENCVEDGCDCDLLIPPRKKRPCERCRRKRQTRSCSYNFEDDHNAPCSACSQIGFKCVAGPAVDPTRARIGVDGKPIVVKVPMVRQSKRICPGCSEGDKPLLEIQDEDEPLCQKCEGKAIAKLIQQPAQIQRHNQLIKKPNNEDDQPPSSTPTQAKQAPKKLKKGTTSKPKPLLEYKSTGNEKWRALRPKTPEPLPPLEQVLLPVSEKERWRAPTIALAPRPKPSPVVKSIQNDYMHPKYRSRLAAEAMKPKPSTNIPRIAQQYSTLCPRPTPTSYQQPSQQPDNNRQHQQRSQNLIPVSKITKPKPTPSRSKVFSESIPSHLHSSHFAPQKIITSYAHPITFLSPPALPCSFCKSERSPYSIYGLGTRLISVRPLLHGQGYIELPNGGGHTLDGTPPDKMCIDCTLIRLSIIYCESHKMVEIPEATLKSINYHRLIGRMMSPKPGMDIKPGAPTREELKQWCSICRSGAEYFCSAKNLSQIDNSSAENQGCPLRLCLFCKTLLEAYYEGDLQRLVKDIPRLESMSEHYPKGIRSDAWMLEKDGALAAQVNAKEEAGDDDDDEDD